jgi:hypothetical protein
MAAHVRLALLSLVPLLIGVAGVADSSAQSCRGKGTIGAQSPLQVGVEVLAGPRQVLPPPLGYLEDSVGLAGSIAGGTDSWFVGGQVGRVRYGNLFEDSDSDMSSTLAGLATGAQLPVTRGRTMMICPVVELTKEFGPPTGVGGTSTLAVRGGMNVGLIAFSRGNLQVVPTAGLAVYRTNMKVEYPTRDVSAYKISVSDTTAQVALGVGVRASRFAITPAWTIPLAESHEVVVGALRGVRYFHSTFRLTVVMNLF